MEKESYFKELDEDDSGKEDLKIGKNDLRKNKIFKSAENTEYETLYRTKYSLNQKIFDDGFDLENDIFIPIKYKYSSLRQYSYSYLRSLRQSIIEDGINNISLNEIEESESDSEDSENNIKNKKTKKIQQENLENKEMFGEERYPPDDDPIGEPPITEIEKSDNELDEENELDEIEINNQNKINQILIADESTGTDFKFTEHILGQVKSPIEMITIGEKIYEFCTKKDNSNEKVDCSSLNTIEMKDIQLFKSLNKNRQFQKLLENLDSAPEDYKSFTQNNTVITSMIIDNRDYNTNCSIWLGTNKSKLIRIPICNKPSKDCQGMVIDTEEVGITSMDNFENYLVTGHYNGTIQIWENQTVFETIKETQCEILQIKFLKINVRKKKYEFIYSDSNGIVNYIRRARYYLMSKNLKEQILSCKEFPIYKICFFSKEKNLRNIKKKNIILALVSMKNISLCRIRPKNEIIITIEIPFGRIGDFVFDCDFGIGYTPISKINKLKGREEEEHISLIEDTVIEEKTKETILFATSYRNVIRLYDIQLKSKYQVKITEIGYYITKNPICKLGFITKSFLALIDSLKGLQLINTFSFVNKIYKEGISPTNHSLIFYDTINLNEYDILLQNNIYFYSSEEKKFPRNTNYIGTVLIFEKNIFIYTKTNFLLYKLIGWDEAINNLCQNEQYKQMIWLSTFLFSKNKNLLYYDTEEKKEGEFESILQDSLYIYIIKGITEENNYKELKMYIEFCIHTDRFKDFYTAKNILTRKNLVKYLYEYIAEYILNGMISQHVFEKDFLKDFIKYYLEKKEISILSKMLLKLNVNNINEPEILKLLEDSGMINLFIYSQTKLKGETKFDYFMPVQYIFSLFENGLKNEQKDENKQAYFNLMTKHDMQFYGDKALNCNDYMGHKLFWYINICLLKEEYPSGNRMSSEAFMMTTKKIFLFLTLNNVMEIMLKFDSFSYFILLKKIFTEKQIYQMMDIDEKQQKYPYLGLESFVKQYLGDVNIKDLCEKYFYNQIKAFIDNDKKNSFKNSIYIKLDFFQMTAYMCKKRKNFFIDKGTVVDAIKFLINYQVLVEGEKTNKYYDPFNLHKIPNKEELLYKEFIENIENNILNLLKYLQNNGDILGSDLDYFFTLEGIKNLYQIKIYLCEYSKRYEDLYDLKLEEFNSHDLSLTKEENLKKFFNWINDTLALTKKMRKTDKHSNDYSEFKQFIKTKIGELCSISVEHTFNLIEKWFNNKEAEICFSPEYDELKYAYLDKYLIFYCEHDEKDKNIESYLRMKIELLIKHDHKEQIIKLVGKNPILWSNDVLNILTKNEVYDAAIFISQKRDLVENCMKLSVAQIKILFDDIEESLIDYSDSLSSEIIFINLEEIKKYLDLALASCASWTEVNRNFNMDDVRNTWLKSLNLFYEFKNDLNKDNENNKLGLKHKSNYFDSVFEKVVRFALENIEYILNKMNDYIPLSMIVKVLCDKMKNSKFKDYSKMLQRMFFNTRRTEEIFRAIVNLFYNHLQDTKEKLIDATKNGGYFESKICSQCHESIVDSKDNNNIYFKCGHIYHFVCCSIEKGHYSCYICRTQDAIDSIYIDIPNLVQRDKENVIKNEIKDKIIIVKEEEKKKVSKKKKFT